MSIVFTLYCYIQCSVCQTHPLIPLIVLKFRMSIKCILGEGERVHLWQGGGGGVPNLGKLTGMQQAGVELAGGLGATLGGGAR